MVAGSSLSANRIRIYAQLINVSDGYHLWSERNDRELSDVFEVQDDISRAIANRLKVDLLVLLGDARPFWLPATLSFAGLWPITVSTTSLPVPIWLICSRTTRCSARRYSADQNRIRAWISAPPSRTCAYH